MHILEIALLGSLRVTLDKHLIDTFRYAKVQALFAYLVIEMNRAHNRSMLAELLWPGEPDSIARKNLRTALATLRQAIGDPVADPPFLLIARDTIQFNQASNHTVDIVTFTTLLAEVEQHVHPDEVLCGACAAKLAQASDMYRGEFAAHVEVANSVAWEEWALLIRERLHGQMLDVLGQLIPYSEQQSDDVRARQYAWRALALEAWDEAAHRCLMRVFARSGQRGSALAQYERCRQVLTHELGVEPAAETMALAEQIREGLLERTVGLSAQEAHHPLIARSMVTVADTILDQPTDTHRGQSGATKDQPSERSQIAVPSPESPSDLSIDQIDTPPRTPPKQTSGNLPVPSTLLIGRQAERAEILRCLSNPACRLLTLLGPGGTGKSRLAIQAAADIAQSTGRSTVWVGLASLTNTTQVATAITDAVDCPLSGMRQPEDQLLEFLREREVLLLLDNFEHVVDATPLILAILQHAPGVRVIVTSRERLHVGAEWVIAVQGLPTPSDDDTVIMRSEAVLLFVERARQVIHTFELSSENGAAIVRICRLLDGMPLAIEIAATWVRMLSVAEIADEIQQDIDFLQINARDLPARHRSIRAVFDYSWTLLAPEERDVLHKLSVFHGGFTREAAALVAGGALPLLAALADTSLLRIDVGSPTRYDLHPLVQQYAAVRLAEEPDAERATYKRHCAYVAEWLAGHEPRIKGAAQHTVVLELSADIDNIRAAWEWATTTRERLAAMLDVFEPLHWLYELRYWFQEGEQIFRRALDVFGPNPEVQALRDRDMDAETQRLLGRVLLHHGYFVSRLGQLASARQRFQASVALLRAAHDDVALVRALLYQGVVSFQMGDLGTAQAHMDESWTLANTLHDRWNMALSATWQGILTQAHDEQEAAKAWFTRGLAMWRRIGSPRGLIVCLSFFSITHYLLHESDEAEVLLHESLDLSTATADQWGIGTAMHHLGLVAAAHGNGEKAAYLHGQSLAIFRQGGNRWDIARGLKGLADATAARGDNVGAAHLYHEALTTAVEAQALPYVLQALFGLATLHVSVNPIAALELLLRIVRHPAADSATHGRAEALWAETAVRLTPKQLADVEKRVQQEPFESRIVRLSHKEPLASLQQRTTPSVMATNLPVSPPPLIGREQDVTAICNRLRDGAVWLLTLVGLPGVGTTRLADAAQLQDDFANRDRMLSNVRRFWVAGVLAHSLHQAVRIELGLVYELGAIEHPWNLVVQQPDLLPRTVPVGDRVIEIFDEFHGTLLILGAPGSGKTTTLLELTSDLLVRAEQDQSLPIPVVFNLSSWATHRCSLTEWLVDELHIRYQVPRAIGKRWVANAQVMPLLDGLDEVALEQRDACVDAINQFRDQFWLLGLVVCSRSADYGVLTTRLRVAGAVSVQPLTDVQVDVYLARAGEQLTAVRTLLYEDASLREFATTPLMLSIMALAYHDMPLTSIMTSGVLEERRKHLFDTYIQRMFQCHCQQRYTPTQIRNWLTWLAQSLTQHSQTLFFIEDLQPNWLPSLKLRRLYAGWVGFATGFIAGVIAGLIDGFVLALQHGVFSIVQGFFVGLLVGGCVGLLNSVLEIVSASESHSYKFTSNNRWLLFRRALLFGCMIGFTHYVAGWLIKLPIDSVAFGVGSAFVFTLGAWLFLKPQEIHSVGTLNWSWSQTRPRQIVALLLSLLQGLLYGLAYTPLQGFIWGVSGWITLSLVIGLTPTDVETKTIPNQGMLQSAITGIRWGGILALSIGLVMGLAHGIVDGPLLGVAQAIRTGFVGGLFGLSMYGGLACIQHFILRILLWRSGAMPWHYARFLDQAAAHVFLSKVGGGYMFVHRLLLEHFAALDDGSSMAITESQTSTYSLDHERS